jgi:hypothetical protein
VVNRVCCELSVATTYIGRWLLNSLPGGGPPMKIRRTAEEASMFGEYIFDLCNVQAICSVLLCCAVLQF